MGRNIGNGREVTRQKEGNIGERGQNREKPKREGNRKRDNTNQEVKQSSGCQKLKMVRGTEKEERNLKERGWQNGNRRTGK